MTQNVVRPVARTLTGTKPFSETSHGAVGFKLGSDYVELGKTLIEIKDSNSQVLKTFVRNTGDGQAYLVVRDDNGGALTTVSRVFNSQTTPYLVSFPVQPLSGSLSEALGLGLRDFFFSEWDPTGQVYTNYDGVTPAVGHITLGRGYWLKVLPEDNAAQKTVTMTGYPPATDTSVVVSAPFGWNLIGYPYPQILNLTNIQVRFLEGDVYAWNDAVAANLVAPKPFAFNGQGYVETEQLDGTTWQSYWLRVYAPSGVTLLLPRPQDATRSVKSTRSASSDAKTLPTWAVAFTARQDKAIATATLGVAPGATRKRDNLWDTEAPPAIIPQVGLAFALPDGEKPSGGRMIGDFREESATRNGVWELRLTSPTGGNVSLGWEGLSSFALSTHQTRLTLVDLTTGQKTPLVSRSAKTFSLAANEVRRLQIITEPIRSLPLALSQFSATPTRSIGAGGRSALQLSYSMTAEAQIQLEVSTLSGKSVKTLQGGRLEGGQVQHLTWDGRDNSGNTLPVGPYMIILRGTDTQGNSIQARRPILLVK